MAVLYIFGSVLVLLLSLPYQATSEIHRIAPDEATDNCSACVTLSQLAANAAFLSNTTLIFLPGSHSLSATLNITDIDRVSIITSNSTVEITCELSTGFSIENVQYTLINNLEFIGCGSNYIKNVTEFILQDVVFEGKGESGTALELIETTATITNSMFISNTHGMFRGNDSLHSNDFWAGGAIIATHSKITIKNSVFERNKAEVGGAIYAENDCIVAIEDTTFVDNQALVQSSTVEASLAMGGVVYQESGSVRISNCLFTNNSALNFNGGVLFSYKSNILIEASEFTENTANYGAALYSYNGSVSIESSQFDRNTATWGGVIHSSNSDVAIDRSQFSDNRATYGGIVDSSGSTVTFNDSQFHRNRATWGGVLHVIEHSKLAIAGSQFNSSTAATRGGVFYINASDIAVQSSQFFNNSASSPGEEFTQAGVLISINSNVQINDSQFYNNTGTYYGGALSCHTSIISISNSQFDGGSATYGGVIFTSGSNVTITSGSEFSQNTAVDQGGAVYLYFGKVSINNSNFYWNSAVTDGGVLYSVEGRVEIERSTIKHNKALNGGAVNLYNSKILLKETVLNNNIATRTAGVLHCSFSSDVIVQASTLNNNTATRTAGALFSSGSSVVVTGSILNNNTAISRAGVLESVNSNITMDDSQLSGNNSTRGGVLYFSNSNIILCNSQMNHSRANFLNFGVGGVLYSFNSRLGIYKSLFHNNTAIKEGGVVYSRNSDVLINGSHFSKNIAIVNGGVVYADNSDVIINGSHFRENIATVNGGVVYTDNGDVTINGSHFSENIAYINGGVVYTDNGDVIINGSHFSENNATVNGGVVYTDTSDVTINGSHFSENIATVNGGVVYTDTSDVTINGSHFSENIAIIDGGVVYTNKNSVVTINGSHFSESIANDYGGVVLTDNSNVTIHNSFFINNYAAVGGVLYSTNSFITIVISKFDGNSAEWGGVIDNFVNGSVIMETNQFYDNRVKSGGGVLRFSKGYVTISNNKFLNNTSDRQGGVLHFIQCQVTIEDSQFIDNHALQGSVLYTLKSNTKVYSLLINGNKADDGTFYLSESTILLSNTTFISNIGSLLAIDTTVNFTGFNLFDNCTTPHISRTNFEEGGALTAFQSMVYFEGITTFHNNQAQSGGAVHLTESVLNILGITLISHNTAARNGGGVYLSLSEVVCQPNSSLRLENNNASRQGGGLHAVGSSIKISIIANETLVNVEDNVAERGGGLSFNSNAKLYVLKRTEFLLRPVYAVQIIGNSADYGGALYVNDGTNAATCESPSTECFLQVLAIHLIQNTTLNTVSLYISNNSARRSVSSATLFGGLLDRCTVSPLAEVHNKVLDINDANYIYNQSGLDYFYESTVFPPDTITSDPVQVCFCFNGYPDCSYLETDLRKVKRGESFVVSLIAVDQAGEPVIASIQSSLKFTQSGLGEGQLFQSVTNNCTDLKFNVFSSEPYEQLTLYADGPCKDADLSRRNITIQFLPCTCPIGFQPQNFNDTTCECQCHRIINQYVQNCDDQTGSLVRRVSASNIWISYSNTSGYLVYPNCPYDYCKPLSLKIPITLGQPNGSDAQCAFNRVSVLCGSCEPGLSLSLGSSRCLSCPHYWPALVVVITLAAAFAGVALVALLLFLNLTVAVGSLNGIIFYANIVAANRNIFFPYQGEPSFASVFISFLNLDIGIDTCFFEGMTMYSKTWLQLVFPFYVILLVVLLIVISSYSDKFSNLIGKKDPVATLATLILLSYARLLGISFIALSAGTLTYVDGSRQIVWLPDATISYFGGVHIPLFIVAILIIIVGLIYTVVVFLWQWLLRLPNKRMFAWTRNQKLQIFIETYNVPYTPHHRYWTGMLLLARIILYLIATVNVSNNPYIALTSITFIIVCILCLKGLTRSRVFKNWPLDLLETFFYFNTLFLAIFAWLSLSGNYDTVSQIAVVNVSVIIAVIVLLLIVLYHIYSYTPIFLKFRETTIGKRLDEAFKSLSETKTEQQRTFETSEDNLLLDMVYRPINTEGYSSTGKQHTPSQLQPTQTVVEVPIRKPNPAMEVTDKELDYISPQKGKESDHSSDTEKHVTDETLGIPYHEFEEERKLH